MYQNFTDSDANATNTNANATTAAPKSRFSFKSSNSSAWTAFATLLALGVGLIIRKVSYDNLGSQGWINALYILGLPGKPPPFQTIHFNQ